MNEQPLRVLVLGDSRSFHIERYVEALKSQGCTVLLASLEDGTISHHRLRKGKPRNRLSYLLAASEIRALITGQFKPDVVNAHYAVGYGATAAIAAIGLSIPIVLQLWGSDILISPRDSLLRRMKAIIALKSADLVLGDSRYLLGEARKLYRFPHGEVIPWGIEQEFSTLYQKNRRWKKPVRIISPRAHEPVYNHHFVLETLKPFFEQGSVQLSLPNWGSGYTQFKQEVETLPDTSILFYSRTSRADFMPFFCEHDIYLSAARSDSSPASLIEAMGLGLLPVCADIPGINEWLTPENGFLFPLDDSIRLHAIIDQLLTQPNDHLPIIEANHAKVNETAVFETNVAQMIALMQGARMHAGTSR